jgi:hypothetical protein
MKVISTKPFNAMGIISAEKGEALEINSEVTLHQLATMGFIEKAEKAEMKAAKKSK